MELEVDMYCLNYTLQFFSPHKCFCLHLSLPTKLSLQFNEKVRYSLSTNFAINSSSKNSCFPPYLGYDPPYLIYDMWRDFPTFRGSSPSCCWLFLWIFYILSLSFVNVLFSLYSPSCIKSLMWSTLHNYLTFSSLFIFLLILIPSYLTSYSA